MNIIVCSVVHDGYPSEPKAVIKVWMVCAYGLIDLRIKNYLPKQHLASLRHKHVKKKNILYILICHDFSAKMDKADAFCVFSFVFD